MAFSTPLIQEQHLLMEVVHELDNNRGDGVNYIIERPPEDGLHEVIRIEDDEDYNVPIYISSDEEEEGDVEMGGEGEDIPPLSDEDEDEESDEEEEDTDDDDNWSDMVSDDSGYDTISEDEEDFEDDEDNIRPRSPLVQQFPPANFWQGWQRGHPPVPAGTPAANPGVPARIEDAVPVCGPVAAPQHLVVRQPQVPAEHLELPGQQVEQREEGIRSQRLEESAPSTSGFSSSTKRIREESPRQEVSAKRLRCKYEESSEESAPSTSGLGLVTNRSREESYMDSAPSASGFGFCNITFGPGPFGYPWWADDNDND